MIFEKGGFLMYPLLIFSILAVAVIAEKIADLYKIAINRNTFNKIVHLSREKNKKDLLLYLDTKIAKNKIYNNSIELIKKAAEQGAGFKKECDVEISLLITKISERIHLLDLVGRISPMIGLTGTVIGLARIFQSVSASGRTGDPAVLAGGIWEVMITTIAGLLIAITSIVAAHAIRSSFKKYIERLKFCCSAVLFESVIADDPK
ncbi:MAG: MotA/TolQ/ExbB proton channel family protein [Spirochaetaceae bacterium]|nr:MotA/TolQ/ExbB proton channel family protein [Spirochaetaceae bacterium]